MVRAKRKKTLMAAVILSVLKSNGFDDFVGPSTAHLTCKSLERCSFPPQPHLSLTDINKSERAEDAQRALYIDRKSVV